MPIEPKNPIRVGLIRCDTHGMWFGPQMMDHDPRLLERAIPDPTDEHETWLRRGVHYFFYTHYCTPWRMTAPRVEGFEIVKLWDADRENAEVASRVFHSRPKVCDTYDQASEGVDLVLIADCNGDGSDHLELARPGLERGVPTFLDKPFAHRYSDVLAIKCLAQKHGAPVMALSMLQTNPSTARFARRLDEVGEVTFGSVTAYAMHPAAMIHAVSIVHHVFGTGIEAVRCVKAPKHTTVHLDYGDRPDRPVHGVVMQVGVARFRFTEMFACAYGREGAIQGRMMNDFDVSEGSAIILEHVRTMVRTGEVTPLSDEMALGIAVMEAAQKAEDTGRPVRVQDVIDAATNSKVKG
jgi:predicted dehydrogenase